MPELTLTVEVPWPKQLNLASLERAIFRSLQAAGRELLTQAFAALEERVVTGAKQRRRRRYLITRFGEIRFHRWQTRTGAGYGYPLDDALGLAPRDPCSAWVRESAAWLAQAHPYRTAARLLSRMIGCPIDHRRLWGWVQSSGRRFRGCGPCGVATLGLRYALVGAGRKAHLTWSDGYVEASRNGFRRFRNAEVRRRIALWPSLAQRRERNSTRGWCPASTKGDVLGVPSFGPTPQSGSSRQTSSGLANPSSS